MEHEIDEPAKCEECDQPLKPGDQVKFINRRGSPGRYRYWHADCFDSSCTPFPKWPIVGLGIRSSKH